MGSLARGTRHTARTGQAGNDRGKEEALVNNA